MSDSPDPKLLDALVGLDAEAHMDVVQRTRRAVMEAGEQMREADRRSRRNFGLVVLALGALLMFLTPMLWVIAEELFSGEQWLDASSITALLVSTIALSMYTAAMMQWRNHSRGESA
ncbi:MAG TPA: hypothetical protein VGT04_09525 [Acidobacteriaceae bacterium]|nr:hypothetical protein [Acidobacteriaceae bacterium]